MTVENKLDEIIEALEKAMKKDEGDDALDAKIRAKLKAEMDRRNFGEADATRHVIDRDRGDAMPKPPKTPKPLLQSEGANEMCKFDHNGQWSIEKSNYGPKGYGLYNANDNAKRKANRTGDEVKDAGKNVAVHNWTTSGSSVQAAHEANEAKARAKNPAPVKTLADMTEEEKASIGKPKKPRAF